MAGTRAEGCERGSGQSMLEMAANAMQWGRVTVAMASAAELCSGITVGSAGDWSARAQAPVARREDRTHFGELWEIPESAT